LVGDSKDEDAEGEVLRWLGVAPHIYFDVRREILKTMEKIEASMEGM
jgi:hypothetical protein